MLLFLNIVTTLSPTRGQMTGQSWLERLAENYYSSEGDEDYHDEDGEYGDGESFTDHDEEEGEGEGEEEEERHIQRPLLEPHPAYQRVSPNFANETAINSRFFDFYTLQREPYHAVERPREWSPQPRPVRRPTQDETSSQGSAKFFVPYPDESTGNSPLFIERKLREMTMPHLRKLCTQLGLQKGGNKPSIVDRLVDKARSFLEHGPIEYNRLLDEFNDEFSEFRPGQRPFLKQPKAEISETLQLQSKKFNLSYGLPFPWALEERLSGPIMTAYVKEDFTMVMEFNLSHKPGARYFLVALRLYPNSDGILIHDPPPRYRHAYANNLVWSVNDLHLAWGRSQASKVKEVTNMVRTGVNRWEIRSFGQLAGKNYFLQIIQAKRDITAWIDEFSKRKSAIRPAVEILSQLKRDFGGNQNGVATNSITITLRCPMSLQRLRTPVRSTNCRHPQCFDLDSYSSSANTAGTTNSVPFKCPICDVPCQADRLFVDGLVREMLDKVAGDDVIIDLEEGSWRQLERRSPRKPERERKRKLSLVDLTETLDVPVDPDSLVDVKPDPGAPLEVFLQIPNEQGAILDDADVVYTDYGAAKFGEEDHHQNNHHDNYQNNHRDDYQNIHRDSRQNGHRNRSVQTGHSLSEAIVLD